MSASSDSSTFSVIDSHTSTGPSDEPPKAMTTPQTMSKKVKVGAVQAEPAWLDLQGSVSKVISLIEEAGRNGVNVLGFPEVFIPGYPW